MKTAGKELGVPIDYDQKPLVVREIIEPDFRLGLTNQLERYHNISFLYHCSIKPGFIVPEKVDGVELRWFDALPDELLKTHIDLYGDIIENYFNGGSRK